MLEKLKGLRRPELLLLAAALASAALLLGGRLTPAESSLEARMARVLSQIDGAGRVSVLINRGAEGEQATGAVIVAEGAEDVRVMLELQRAAKALLGLELEAIEVFDREEGTR